MRYDISKVVRARMVRGWTQAELARRVDCHYSTICNIERGVGPSPTTMKRIADELGLRMKDLVIEECAK